MTYKPGFRRTDEDIEKEIEKTLDQKLAESTKAIETKLDERTRPLEDIAKTLQERDRKINTRLKEEKW